MQAHVARPMYGNYIATLVRDGPCKENPNSNSKALQSNNQNKLHGTDWKYNITFSMLCNGQTLGQGMTCSSQLHLQYHNHYIP